MGTYSAPTPPKPRAGAGNSATHAHARNAQKQRNAPNANALALLITLFVLSFCSCRTSYRTHQTSQTDSLTLTRTLHGDIFQIHERFDSLGRLVSRSQTLTRSSDSISLNTQSKQTTHQTQKTEPTTTTHLISSSKQTLTLIGFGIALGIVIAFLIKRKLLS